MRTCILLIINPEDILILFYNSHIAKLSKDLSHLCHIYIATWIRDLYLQTVALYSCLVVRLWVCMNQFLFAMSKIKYLLCINVHHNPTFKILQTFEINWSILKCRIMHSFLLRLLPLLPHSNCLPNLYKLRQSAKHNTSHIWIIPRIMTLFRCLITQKCTIMRQIKHECNTIRQLFVT